MELHVLGEQPDEDVEVLLAPVFLHLIIFEHSSIGHIKLVQPGFHELHHQLPGFKRKPRLPAVQRQAFTHRTLFQLAQLTHEPFGELMAFE